MSIYDIYILYILYIVCNICVKILYMRALKDLKMVKICPKHVILVYKYSSNIKNCCTFDLNISNKYYAISTTLWIILKKHNPYALY